MTEPTRYVIEDEHEGHKFVWVLSLAPSHGPKPPQVPCQVREDRCRHHNWSGMYSNPDDPLCWRCGGTGYHDDPNFRWTPTPPKELVDNLLKIVRDYWNKQQNEKFELK